MTELDDEALAERARTDPEAFGELYERYVDPIFRFVYSRVRNREAAEDVTSEVFYKAMRGIDGFRPSGRPARPFRAWLYRIAVNAATDRLRGTRPTTDIDGAIAVADRAPAVDEQVLGRLDVEAVMEALETLNAVQRTALVLKLGHDMRAVDIAAIVGKSEGATKVLIHRALTNLRQRLERRAATAEVPS